MIPTLNEVGDVVLLENLDKSLPYGGLQVGDVVMARSPTEPTNPDAYVCKRIHALPGDPVRPEIRVPIQSLTEARVSVLSLNGWLAGWLAGCVRACLPAYAGAARHSLSA